MKVEKFKAIDIIKLASGHYKIGLDMACERKSIYKADPWYLIIKCVNGEIYPFSSRLLAFHCVKRIIRNRLHEDHPEIMVRNWSYNGEANFLFEMQEFDLVRKYACPRKVRKLSEHHKAILAKCGCEALKAYRKYNSKLGKIEQNQAMFV